MHLRNLNQYVQGALGEWVSKHGRMPLVPRTSGQQAFKPEDAAGQLAAVDDMHASGKAAFCLAAF